MAQKWWTFLRCVGAFEVTPELYLPLGNYIERDLAPCKFREKDLYTGK